MEDWIAHCPVTWVKYAAFITVRCRDVTLLGLYAQAGKWSWLIFCDMCPPAAKPDIRTAPGGVMIMWPPPQSLSTMCIVDSFLVLLSGLNQLV